MRRNKDDDKNPKRFRSCQFQKGKQLRPTKEKEQEAETHKLRRRRKLQKQLPSCQFQKGNLPRTTLLKQNRRKNIENEREGEIRT